MNFFYKPERGEKCDNTSKKATDQRNRYISLATVDRLYCGKQLESGTSVCCSFHCSVVIRVVSDEEGVNLMDNLVLTNDQQRKDLLGDFYENPWEHIRCDEELELNFYRVSFRDGSYITAIVSRYGYHIPALLTLTKPGQPYSPERSTQGELIDHLRKVAGRQ